MQTELKSKNYISSNITKTFKIYLLCEGNVLLMNAY